VAGEHSGIDLNDSSVEAQRHAPARRNRVADDDGVRPHGCQDGVDPVCERVLILLRESAKPEWTVRPRREAGEWLLTELREAGRQLAANPAVDARTAQFGDRRADPAVHEQDAIDVDDRVARLENRRG
jgi:hypothetical protein